MSVSSFIDFVFGIFTVCTSKKQTDCLKKQQMNRISVNKIFSRVISVYVVLNKLRFVNKCC